MGDEHRTLGSQSCERALLTMGTYLLDKCMDFLGLASTVILRQGMVLDRYVSFDG